MNQFHIVKEYILFYMFRRKLSREEFCKICEIDIYDLYAIERNDENFKMDVLEKISKYIHVPMNKLYVDLDDLQFRPLTEEYTNLLNKDKSYFTFD